MTILADLKARRGRVDEANALYEQAEDVIESMLISVDEPYAIMQELVNRMYTVNHGVMQTMSFSWYFPLDLLKFNKNLLPKNCLLDSIE